MKATLMRAQHTAHALPAFPVYSCAFIDDDQVIVGGGGGTSRTGIKNKLKLFRVSDDRQLHVLNELELERGDDAPMSMATHPQSRTLVCGVNSSPEKLERGENENCRKFAVSKDEHKFAQLATCGTLTFGGLDDYQRVTVLSPDGRYLVIAGAHTFSLLDYNSLLPVIPSIHISNGEIYDATFSSSHLFLVTSLALLVYALPTRVNGNECNKTVEGGIPKSNLDYLPKDLHLIKTIDPPSISGIPCGSNITFRAVRTHPIRRDTLYSVVNVALPRVKHTKLAKKRAYILKWRIVEKRDSFDICIETIRKVCDANLTCFDVSFDGRLLAFGASDYSLSVLDSNTLTPLLFILKAHEFPITTLRFSPTSKLLVSGGVDSSIRVVSIPEVLGGQPWGTVVLILIAIAAFIIAVLMRR